ncbi:phosphotransferase [Streptomyces sp. 769]|uniref:phosphotransferase n=1 Tax=Streptomyces sp. 769 TaxID=1262452 RepID=UPI000A8823E0|nr:phosphotransferase [Streptomyces sp. 769]
MTLPAPAEVRALLDRQILNAADTLWPQRPVRLGAVVPSEFSFVRRVDVAGRPLFAKASLLGMSMPAVLLGAGGDLTRLRAEQADYLSRPGELLDREARQLSALSGLGLRVAGVAGSTGGVLFTTPAPGPTLSEAIERHPRHTADLLAATARELRCLRCPALGSRLHGAAIAEQSIAATFLRKFNGISGSSYLMRTGHAHHLAPIVARLHAQLRPGAAGRRVWCYGDLEPEHVLFADGPESPPTFIDPSLSHCLPGADLAKVVSRTALRLVTGLVPEGRADDTQSSDHILDGVAAHVEASTPRESARAAQEWLRRLLVLWLADTVNTLSTSLTAPEDFPLPGRCMTTVTRIDAVCTLLDHLSAALADREPACSLWRRALAETRRTVASERYGSAAIGA